ncbi:MAG: hypothetical protein Q4D81_06995 [Eubacteriales bacterium]|nr:hypothetical protein [Eubacteriales bacterium]
MGKIKVSILCVFLVFSVCIVPVSANHLSTPGTDHSGIRGITSSAAASDETPSSDEKDIAYQKTVTAYQEFIDGQRGAIFHEDRTDFACFPWSSLFSDGEQFFINDLIAAFSDPAEKGNASDVDSSEEQVTAPIRYAVLESDTLPLLALNAYGNGSSFDLLGICFIMYYDPVKDEIHLALGEDSWNKIAVRVNRNGIVGRYVSLNAFQEEYFYRRVTGSGEIEFIYRVFYDNSAIQNTDLTEEEKKIHLATYVIPSEEEIQSGQEMTIVAHTLHKLLSGDTTFVYETLVSTSSDNPVAALYTEDGTQLEHQMKIMVEIFKSMKRMGLAPEEFFDDEPEWTVKQ